MVGSSAEWIFNVSGIDERRFAAEDETIVDMGALAARGLPEERRREGFRRGDAIGDEWIVGAAISGTPRGRGVSAGASTAFRLSICRWQAPAPYSACRWPVSWLKTHGTVLVVAAEKMSSVVLRQPMNAATSVLFGDGAGACLITAEGGAAWIVDSTLHTDGSFSEDLKLECAKPLEMNGRVVILQASRKILRAIETLLERNGRTAGDIDCFLMHQANQNLIVRIAQAMGVEAEKFYSNIRRYGNTSSASMLIAASEWVRQGGFRAREFR